MKLFIDGFEEAYVLGCDKVTAITIENPMLLARLVQSISSGLGRYALEPYALLDERGMEVKPQSSFMVVRDLFDLPWDDRSLLTAAYRVMAQTFEDNEQMRLEVAGYAGELRSKVFELGLSLKSDYAFAVEWDLVKFLKAFGYKPEFQPEDSLLDSLIKFISYLSDVGFKKVLVLVNIASFLSAKDIVLLSDRLVFYQIRALFLDSQRFEIDSEHLGQHVIDQHFLVF